MRLRCCVLLLWLPLLAVAQSITPEARLTNLESAVKSAQSAGDNAWMLASAALVLMMTGPGLALFYGGLVRRKNVLGTMMHSFILMAVVSVIWAMVGYSLAFGEGTAFLGDLRYLFLNGVGSAPNPDYAGTIPQQTFMIYQLMFAIITPALISGAFAERMKFSAMLLFTVLWAFVVYFPLAHMVWGKGGLLNAFLGGKIPSFDFAGGTVVHISSGVSALVCALYLGKRKGYGSEPMKPHNVVISVIGACLLWVGWFGFNAGSAVAASATRHQRIRRHAFRNGGRGARLDAGRMGAQRQTQRAGRDLGRGRGTGRHHARLRFRQADARAFDRLRRRRAVLLHGHHGQGQVRLRRHPGRVRRARRRRHAGRSADRRLRHQRGQRRPQRLERQSASARPGGWHMPARCSTRAIAVLISWGLAIVGTLIILKICDVVVGLRVAPDQEIDGLDVSMHGEEGYNFEA